MFKKFLLLSFISGILTSQLPEAAAAEWDPAGVNKIWTKSISKKEHKNSVDFTFNVPEPGYYRIGFVACPPCLVEGDYSSYEVMIDDQDFGIAESYEPGWHIYEIDYGNWNELSEGKHTISILTPSPFVASTAELIISASGDWYEDQDSDEKWRDLAGDVALKALASSAKKIGTDNYIDSDFYRVKGTRNDRYGFGLLNASGAIRILIGSYIYKQWGEYGD